jgi:hypothetical protein
MFDECAENGGFGGIATADGAYWAFGDLDNPGPDLVALRIWRAGSAPESTTYALEADERGQRFRTLEDAHDLAAGDAVGREFKLDRARRLWISLVCQGEPCPGAAAWVRFSRMEMVFSDPASPRVLEATGTAFAAPEVSGSVSINARWTDIGGGLRTIAVLVDGQVRQRSTPKCPAPYTRAIPCPLSGTDAFDLDTRELSDGDHTVSLRLTDVAGNESVTKSYRITVHNTEAPAPRMLRLVAEPATIKASFDAEPVVRATIRDASGAPASGVKVGVSVRVAATGAAFVLDTPVFSDANGNVTVKLPKGPSREVKLTYGAQVAIAKITVKAPVRLKVSPRRVRNGHSIRLKGTVPGAQEETKVELQARSGKKWIPFKTVTLREGKFGARYRFARTFARTRYAFRAVIHRDARFPYAPATSKVASVTVTP